MRLPTPDWETVETSEALSKTQKSKQIPSGDATVMKGV